MTKEDKYLLGVLWKFGTIKPGTNQFVFQSYDKYDQMEYIRKRLAPDKVIKVSERKDPRSGAVKTLYRLNFTNADWADKVRNLLSIEDINNYLDEDFIRGFLETKSDVSKNGTNKCFKVSLSNIKESDVISLKISEICETNVIKTNNNFGKTCMLRYFLKDTIKIVNKFSSKNPKYWGEILKKMNPDE